MQPETEDQMELIDSRLDEVLGCCSRLESLVVEWPYHDDIPTWTPRFLQSKMSMLGKTLRLLSLHSVDSLEIPHLETSDVLPLALFDQVCSQCPLLEQLGYRLCGRQLVEDGRCFMDTLVSSRFNRCISFPRN